MPYSYQVKVPAAAKGDIEVYLNGVKQEAGKDFTRAGQTLYFERHIEQEGKLGLWRWLSMALGIAGTYRKNDSVDVVYTVDGKKTVAASLPIEPTEPPAASDTGS